MSDNIPTNAATMAVTAPPHFPSELPFPPAFCRPFGHKIVCCDKTGCWDVEEKVTSIIIGPPEATDFPLPDGEAGGEEPSFSGGEEDDETPPFPEGEEPPFPKGEEPSFPKGHEEEEPSFSDDEEGDEEPEIPSEENSDEAPSIPHGIPHFPGGFPPAICREIADKVICCDKTGCWDVDESATTIIKGPPAAARSQILLAPSIVPRQFLSPYDIANHPLARPGADSDSRDDSLAPAPHSAQSSGSPLSSTTKLPLSTTSVPQALTLAAQISTVTQTVSVVISTACTSYYSTTTLPGATTTTTTTSTGATATGSSGKKNAGSVSKPAVALVALMFAALVSVHL